MDEVACHEARLSAHGTMHDSEGSCHAADTASRRIFAKIVKMRTYQDRYILALLQKEAIGENPGFQPIHEETHRAKIIWVGEGKNRQPAGYYIYCEKHFEYIKMLGREVCYPATFSQLYVSKQMRRLGLATLMVRDFIRNHGPGAVWVESPKYETRMLLGKLGYCETDRPYDLWEMVEGLSRWSRISKGDRGCSKLQEPRVQSFSSMHRAVAADLASQHG